MITHYVPGAEIYVNFTVFPCRKYEQSKKIEVNEVTWRVWVSQPAGGGNHTELSDQREEPTAQGDLLVVTSTEGFYR